MSVLNILPARVMFTAVPWGVAVLLGLAGHEPDTVDVEAVPHLLRQVRLAWRAQQWGLHAANPRIWAM